MKRIGVLAIQGDFDKHKRMLQTLGQEVTEVRTAEQLLQTDALVIPGGESTTLIKFFDEFRLDAVLQQYAADHPIMGTCAGLIVLARSVDHPRQRSLELIDVDVIRNAYGRQKESFIAEIQVNLNGSASACTGVFIRAPKITRHGRNIRILGRHHDDIVLAASDNILVCTFHPELSNDTRIHAYFINTFLKK
jgi:pyridoxal 5'-phosphate synthase pdxT subunit